MIGPSGAGKTTLLQAAGLCAPAVGGRLRLDGRDPWTLPRAELHRLRGQLFLAPQVPPLPPRQRVVTAVLAGRLPRMGLWRACAACSTPPTSRLADDALARFDLAEKLFERVDRLSGGERQRVGLARALLAPAELWLVDEPLSALDPTRARQAIASLTQAARERGATLVATLHHVDMALAHFPRIIGLREGELLSICPPRRSRRDALARLYAQHQDELRGEAPPEDPGASRWCRRHCTVAVHCR